MRCMWTHAVRLDKEVQGVGMHKKGWRECRMSVNYRYLEEGSNQASLARAEMGMEDTGAKAAHKKRKRAR